MGGPLTKFKWDSGTDLSFVGLLFRQYVCGKERNTRISHCSTFHKNCMTNTLLDPLSGPWIWWRWELKVDLSFTADLFLGASESRCPGPLCPSRLEVLHASCSKSDILATLESNDGVGVNMGNVKGAIMVMRVTNDCMAGCGGPRTLYLVGCG